MNNPAASNTVKHCSFNLEEDLFVTGTKTGFVVYQTDPHKETVRRIVPGGVLLVELLGRSNFLAVVTVRRPHCIQFWDDTCMAFKMELELGNEVIKSVKLRRDIVVCVLSQQVRIYRFTSTFPLLHAFDTVVNDKGLVAISSSPQCIVAFPARRVGFLQIVHSDILESIVHEDTAAAAAAAGKKPSKVMIVSTNSSALGCLAMNASGTMIATASITGTLIRVWDTTHGHQIVELRRGMDSARIESMSFSPVSETMQTKLAVISHKATAHIYHVLGDVEGAVDNKKSTLSGLASLGVPYFGSRWSIAQARIEEPPLYKPRVVPANRQYLIAWTSTRVFVVLSSDGSFWKYIVAMGKQPNELIHCQQEAFRRWQ